MKWHDVTNRFRSHFVVYSKGISFFWISLVSSLIEVFVPHARSCDRSPFKDNSSRRLSTRFAMRRNERANENRHLQWTVTKVLPGDCASDWSVCCSWRTLNLGCYRDSIFFFCANAVPLNDRLQWFTYMSHFVASVLKRLPGVIFRVQ